MTNRLSVNALRAVVAVTVVLMMISRLAYAQSEVFALPFEDQQKINAHLGSGVVGKALPSTSIEDVTTYFPLQSKPMTYQVTSGPHSGKTQTLGLAQARRPNGKTAWRFQLSSTLASFINQTPEGDLMMPAVSDAREGVVVITTRANPFLFKGMRPGETRSYSQQVSVLALDNPADQEYSGAPSGTYTYVGTYRRWYLPRDRTRRYL